jgi:uncharacterized protein YjbI with pentapeptide repeats
MILQFLHDEHLIPARGPGIHLGSVNLSGAHLIGANLTGANMPYADLSGADLSGVANLAQEQINVVKGDENTKLQGLQRPGSWKNT